MRELMMQINTDLPPCEGLGFLGPPSWTSKSFNLLNYLPLEMVSPVVLLYWGFSGGSPSFCSYIALVEISLLM